MCRTRYTRLGCRKLLLLPHFPCRLFFLSSVVIFIVAQETAPRSCNSGKHKNHGEPHRKTRHQISFHFEKSPRVPHFDWQCLAHWHTMLVKGIRTWQAAYTSGQGTACQVASCTLAYTVQWHLSRGICQWRHLANGMQHTQLCVLPN